MNKTEADALIETIRGFIDKPHETATARDRGPRPAVTSTAPATNEPPPAISPAGIELKDAGGRKFILTPEILDAMYRAFKDRMIDELRVDPVFLRLLATAPELEVEIQPRTVTLDASTLKGRVARLIADGWLDDTRTTYMVRKELSRTGPDPGGGGNLANALKDLQRDGFLFAESDGWRRAPGIKVTARRLES